MELTKAAYRDGDCFNEASSKVMVPSPPRSSPYFEREKRSSNAMTQAQASFTLSFAQGLDRKTRATAPYGQVSSAALDSTTQPQNFSVTFQVPGNQQVDFVETRTTPDGAFVMKWAYRPAQTESHPRLLSPPPDHSMVNDVGKSSLRRNVTKSEDAPVRSRKSASRGKVSKSDISGAEQRLHASKDDRARHNGTSEMSRARTSHLNHETAASDEHGKFALQPKPQDDSSRDALRRKFSLRNLLTPPSSIADQSAPTSPRLTTQEDILSDRYRTASECMEKAITSLQRELLGESTPLSDEPVANDDLTSSVSQRSLSRRKAALPDRTAMSPARQPTPHPDLGKMLNNGRTSNAGRSHKHSQTTTRSFRPALSFRNDLWLDAATPISPEKENRSPNSRAEK
jgi:hypothetical protein